MTIRFGLVGAGAIARSYLEVFDGLTDAGIVAIADVHEPAARELAERTDGTAYPSHTALLGDAQVDAVLVCTPPSSHAEVVLHAVAAGCHVLCEKPLALDAASARVMVSAANAAGVLFTMASKFRFVADVREAQRIMDAGVLGEVVELENAFASRVSMLGRWNADAAVSGGGVLIDNGTHSVDVARALLGPISEVLAIQGRRVQPLPVEDSARLMLRTADGTLGAVDLSWSYDSASDAYLVLHGTEGSLRVGWTGSSYRRASSGLWVRFGAGYDKIACMRSQVRNFCAAVRGEEPLAVTAEDAIASVAVIEAAYASMATGAWTPVAPLGIRSGAADEQVA